MAINKTTTTMENHVSGQANQPLSKPAHALPPQTVVSEIGANIEDGLTSSEARIRLDQHGRNELGDSKGVAPGKILIRQIANAMILVLLLAMAASFGIQSWIEGGVISFVIGLNIVVGFRQEYKAEKTMDSLRSLSSPTANVVRDGANLNIPTAEVVPGDMVELTTGDTVPADVRLIEAVNFETDEALLTGESLPVHKRADDVFEENTGPGDRINVAYSSSTVTKGRAIGVVYATGMYTEIGSIASALRGTKSRLRPVKKDEDGFALPHQYIKAWTLTASDAIGRFLGVNVGTPLQKKLSQLAILLFGIAVVCAIIVLAANYFANQQEVIIYAVATGLSMIPASLIVVLTITMAAGTKRMVQRNVIVRNMKALEALGGVTDICSDKTGTITQGKMVAKRAWIPAKGTYSVGFSNEPFNPTAGGVSFIDQPPTELDSESDDEKRYNEEATSMLTDNQALEDFLNIASLANLSHVHKGKDDEWLARGDPTEIALQVFAARFDWNRSRWISGDKPTWKELAEFPFDSDVKRMSMIYENCTNGKKYVFAKGAVERILDACHTVCIRSESGKEDTIQIDENFREEVLENMEALAQMGLRVLALASKPYDDEFVADSELDRKDVEKDLVFRGLVGIYDPPRLESAHSVELCRQAGIVVHMLTGDHPGTAQAIAKEVGILPTDTRHMSKDRASGMVMTAAEFDKLSDDELDNLPNLPLVVARCAPNTKVRMIDALHRRKKFVAMTGDGVNDSPSLKRADVGIAMGQTGSDVAKDASDIILTDDNFRSILNAVEEGRRMFDNIKKFILHLLAQNIAQALILLLGLVFKDETGYSVFPISPVEIMWIIMVTSGAPDMGLGFEAAAADILDRPPHDSSGTGIFSLELILDMLVYGVWIAALCLAAFAIVMFGIGDGSLGQRCNDHYSEECVTVFRARATLFACLTWFSLFLAWEMVHMRRSFFRMRTTVSVNPNSSSSAASTTGSVTHTTKAPWYQFVRDVWANQFLFWAIVVGFVTIFPVLYIPVINRVVFKHTGISWEWIIVFVETALFFAGVEGWKWLKRVYFRRREAKEQKVRLEKQEEERMATEMTMPFSTAETMCSEDGRQVRVLKNC